MHRTDRQLIAMMAATVAASAVLKRNIVDSRDLKKIGKDAVFLAMEILEEVDDQIQLSEDNQ